MSIPRRTDPVSTSPDFTPNELMTSVQASAIADAAAPTAYTAHASGATAVTSNAATDLDTTAAALATLRGEVATLTTKVNAIIAALESAKVIAS